jgi:hypothetical protein
MAAKREARVRDSRFSRIVSDPRSYFAEAWDREEKRAVNLKTIRKRSEKTAPVVKTR